MDAFSVPMGISTKNLNQQKVIIMATTSEVQEVQIIIMTKNMKDVVSVETSMSIGIERIIIKI